MEQKTKPNLVQSDSYHGPFNLTQQNTLFKKNIWCGWDNVLQHTSVAIGKYECALPFQLDPTKYFI